MAIHGICIAILVYFMAIGYFYGNLGTYFPNLVCCTKKNLATPDVISAAKMSIQQRHVMVGKLKCGMLTYIGNMSLMAI
jgi:hypothetical protein